jgi:peptidyl-tRNA hydrolase, PTH1 family
VGRFGAPGAPDQRPVILAKPATYMNESGGPVKALSKYYSVAPAQLIVLHDELDVDFGLLRLKFGGGEGGHNGLKSISSALGTRDYYRLRVGIGRPPGRQDPADFVLRDFTSGQQAELAVVLAEAVDAVVDLVTHGLQVAQNTWHRAG